MKDPFAHLVGQDELKRTLNFYLSGQKANGTLPFLLFKGAKGLGKTEFAKAMRDGIPHSDGSRRPFLELNCSTLKNVESFFEQIFIPILMDKEVVVLFDEAHELPRPLVNAFLSICNVERGTKKKFAFAESEYLFDWTKLVFMFATTECDRLFGPFKDRLTEVDFRAYTLEELAEILTRALDWVDFKDGIEEDIVKTTRGNARSVIKRAKEIEIWCEGKNQSEFGAKEWKDLCFQVGIKPRGLTNLEIQVLSLLKTRGDCTLQMLSAATGMSRRAIQRDAEIYLLQENLILIDGKRKLRAEGQKVLQELEHAS